MGFSIRKASVARLARELADLRATNMTEAVEKALVEAIERERSRRPLEDRILDLVAKIKAEAGPNARPVTKDEIDDMWGQ